MSQFLSTEHANECARDAFKGYEQDRNRIEKIQSLVKRNIQIPKEEILWLCDRANWGISQEESSWYDHG